MNRKIISALVIFLMLQACTITKKGCQFQYTDEFKETYVLPYLRENVGAEMLPFFNVDDPVLTDKGGVTRLVVSPIKIVDGRIVMYENSFVFIVKNCTRELVDSFTVVRN